MWSEPIVFKLIVDTDAETKKREVEVEARVTIGDARFVGGGSGIREAMDSLLGAVRSSPEGNVRRTIVSHAVGHREDGMSPQEGYFRMLGRTFAIEVPVKRNEKNEAVELTDEEARPIHAALLRILDEAEREIRRKLQAIYPTFKLRSQ